MVQNFLLLTEPKIPFVDVEIFANLFDYTWFCGSFSINCGCMQKGAIYSTNTWILHSYITLSILLLFNYYLANVAYKKCGRSSSLSGSVLPIATFSITVTGIENLYKSKTTCKKYGNYSWSFILKLPIKFTGEISCYGV